MKSKVSKSAVILNTILVGVIVAIITLNILGHNQYAGLLYLLGIIVLLSLLFWRQIKPYVFDIVSIVAITTTLSAMFWMSISNTYYLVFYQALFVFGITVLLTFIGARTRYILWSYIVLLTLATLLHNPWIYGLWIIVLIVELCLTLGKKQTLNFKTLLWLGVIIKSLLIIFMSIDMVGFGQFIQSYIANNFQQPWDIFLQEGLINIFPYHSGMLHILTAWFTGNIPLVNLMEPKVISTLSTITLQSFTVIFDLALFAIITRLLENRTQFALIWYWLNPIILVSLYLYGQLELVPIAFFVLSFIFLQEKNYKASIFAFIGSLTIKHIAILAFPLYLLYIAHYYSWKKVLKYLSASILAIGTLFELPYLLDPSYQELVLNHFSKYVPTYFKIPIVLQYSLVVFIAVIIWYYALAYLRNFERRINSRELLIITSIAFMLLAAVTLPSHAWYIWTIPGLITAIYTLKSKRFMHVVSGYFLLYFIHFIIWEETLFKISTYPLKLWDIGLSTSESILTFIENIDPAYINMAFTALGATLIFIAVILFNHFLPKQNEV